MVDTYECPTCSWDMTDQVNTQCGLVVIRPLVVEQVGVKRNELTHAEKVMLQCPNGHWAEYPCPKSS